jgi:hypothetical protein
VVKLVFLILIPTYIYPRSSISTWRLEMSSLFLHGANPMLSVCSSALVITPSSIGECNRHSIHPLFDQIPQAPFSLVLMAEFVDGSGRCDVDGSSGFDSQQIPCKPVECASKIRRQNQGNQQPLPLLSTNPSVDTSGWIAMAAEKAWGIAG